MYLLSSACRYMVRNLQDIFSRDEAYYVSKIEWVNPGRFGPGSFRPGSFRPGSFRPNLGMGRFGLGRWVVSAQGRFGQI